jgi:hypothetical protein
MPGAPAQTRNKLSLPGLSMTRNTIQIASRLPLPLLQVAAKERAQGNSCLCSLGLPFMQVVAKAKAQGRSCLCWQCSAFCVGYCKGKGPGEKLPVLTGFAFRAGGSKGKGPGDRLPLLAVQCLEALLNLGRTAEGVAEVLQDVPMAEDHVAMASDAGTHKQCCFYFIA